MQIFSATSISSHLRKDKKFWKIRDVSHEVATDTAAGCYLVTATWTLVPSSVREKIKMAENQLIHRRILQSAIGALCSEQGFSCVSKMALETLTEMLQSCKYKSSVGSIQNSHNSYQLSMCYIF